MAESKGEFQKYGCRLNAAAWTDNVEPCGASQRDGFIVLRQPGHVVMGRGLHGATSLGHNPINALTVGAIAKAAGLTPEEFCRLL